MHPEAFTAAAWGRLVQMSGGNAAFVPNRAPRRLELSYEAVGLLDEASNRIGVLEGIARRLPNPQLLVGPYLRQEAVLSSRIEGTESTLADVYAAEAEQLSLVAAPDVQEVANYVEAYEFGLKRLEQLPLSLRLLRELHGKLMQDVRGHARQPGEFRSYQNFVGGTSEANATYVGPPVPEMHSALDDLERFMHERTLRPLVQMAVLHYQFEAIHPFGDGNGRVGRLLMGIFLAERGLMPQPLLYLSAFFERTRSTYYDLLMRVSTHGDWDAWLRYVLHAVAAQADEAAEVADRLQDLQQRYRDVLHGRHATVTALAMVDGLFVNPVLNTRLVQEVLGVSAPTARSAITALVDTGILTEITGRRRDRVYRADEIFAVLDGRHRDGA